MSIPSIRKDNYRWCDYEKKVLFITGFCLIASLLYSQRSSPGLLKVTISHQANGGCQSVYLEIKNVSNKMILIMDGSDIDSDGIGSLQAELNGEMMGFYTLTEAYRYERLERIKETTCKLTRAVDYETIRSIQPNGYSPF